MTPTPTPDVYRAISAATKALSKDGISKDKKNEQQGYKFRGIDDIYNALSAVIAGAELCILPRMSERTQEERATKTGGVLFYVTVRADFDFVSARDGSKHTVTMYGEAMDSADKATNKAMSAAYKYACLQVFCIPTEGMAEDADATTPTVEPKAAHRPVVSQPRGSLPAKGQPPSASDGAPVPAELVKIFERIEKDPTQFVNAAKMLEDGVVDRLGTVEGLKAYDAVADEFYARFPNGTSDVRELKTVLRKLHQIIETAPPKQ